jgi:hypothetical protein
MLNYDKLPNPNMAEGLRRYFEQRVLPGGFLTAVLSNDLRAACEAADYVNQRLLFEHVSWLYNEAPVGSWGSESKVRAWIGAPTPDKAPNGDARLRDALAGLMGLIQLATHNPDLHEPLRSNLQTNHRFLEARAALAAAEGNGGVR